VNSYFALIAEALAKAGSLIAVCVSPNPPTGGGGASLAAVAEGEHFEPEKVGVSQAPVSTASAAKPNETDQLNN
jgi:hypothetical protein